MDKPPIELLKFCAIIITNKMNRVFKIYLQATFIIIDLAMLCIAFFFTTHAYQLNYFDNEILFYFYFICINIITWFICIIVFSLYREHIIIEFEKFTKRSFQTYILWLSINLILFLEFKIQQLDQKIVLVYFGLFFLGIAFNRVLYIGIKNYYQNKDFLFNRVIIIGYNTVATKLASYFEEETVNIKLIGFVENEQFINQISHYPVFSDIRDTIKIARENKIQEIYSTISPKDNNEIYEIMSFAEKECIRFKLVPNLNAFVNKSFKVDFIRDLPILTLRTEPLEDVGNKILKRALDIIISSLVIVFILSWLIPLIAILIKLNSKGPVFFIQQRTGKNNSIFNCLKFRTMKTNAFSDKIQATKHDDRITKLGAFLRKSSLDEFPQFINVFTGEMSLVGPRPHMVKHTHDYSEIVDEYMTRLFLKPGITGWAQINGLRGEIKNDKEVMLRVSNDLWYLENWSILLDIKIIILTFFNIIKGDKKAY